MLLISTERHEEYDFNLKYARLARGRAEHWNIADVQHTHGLRDHPRGVRAAGRRLPRPRPALNGRRPPRAGADRIASGRERAADQDGGAAMATRQQVQTAVGAHLVGGLKAPDPEAMRTAAGILGGHLGP